MEAAVTADARTILLGIGNILLSDDGVGVHVANALNREMEANGLRHPLTVRDGGTIGLSLLSEIDPASALIAVDAMEMGAQPGTVRLFRDAAMDRQLAGSKRSAHEVALADLIQAARLSGCAPPRRALVGIQPEVTSWGLEPTPAVAAAIPRAVQCILNLLEEWHDES
jgi:hydrogenase maturation protease